MGLKEIHEFSEMIRKQGIQCIENPEYQKRFQELTAEMDENWDAAKERVCQNHTEAEIAELLNEIRSLVVSSMYNGSDFSLIKLEFAGTLKEFGDTYAMAVIGALIMEGIL